MYTRLVTKQLLAKKRKLPQDVRNTARAVAYLRVSTDEQVNGLDVQRTEIAEWAHRNRIKCEHYFADKGVSRSSEIQNRPAFVELMAHVYEREHKIAFIVIQKVDRLGSDMLQRLLIEKMLEARDIRIISINESLEDLDRPEIQLSRNILSSVAQFERQLISSRTKAGLAAAQRSGVTLGRPRYEATPAGREIVRQIQALHAGGMSLRGIAQALYTAGIRTLCGKHNWHKTQIVRCLSVELASTEEV